MKEQVKKWIVDKNLTIDSFDSIMIGVIYNSYHNTLDDPDVREWIGMHPSEFREMLPPNLNENQQIVLEYLKYRFGKYDDVFVRSIFSPIDDLISECWDDELNTAFEQLDLKQEIQVLQVFSQLVLEQEEE